MRARITITGTVLALLTALPAHAATFQHGDTLNILVPVRDNLYAAGGTVTVEQAVEGDLLAAGGTIRVQGSVGNTLQAGGGQVTVLGPVSKSARLAGGTVTVSSNVGGDLILMGGQVSVESGAVIGGDVVMLGGTLTMNGVVKGGLKAYGGQVLLQGSVDGPVDINAEDVTVTGTVRGESRLSTGKLTLGTGAAFGKPVRYWRSEGQLDFGSAAKEGAAVYDESLKRVKEEKAYDVGKGAAAAIATAFGIYSLFSSALVLVLLLLLWRGFFARAGQRLVDAPGWSLLTGFLYFVATPVLGVLLLATIVGIPLGIFVLLLYAFSYVFGGAITAILMARWIELWRKQTWSLGIFFLVSLLVLVMFKLLIVVPVLGWIARSGLLFMAVGALLSTLLEAWKRVRAPAA